MSDAFDPYHKWLAIPAEEQPPNHYRLLGVHLFEEDADVIDSAADRQMGHVRRFATGQRGELSQKILNEISTAKVTLLNPEKRAAYDAALRKKVAAKEAAAKPLPKAQALPTAQSLPQAQSIPVSAQSASPQLRTCGQQPQQAASGGFDIPIVDQPKSVAQRRKKKSSPALTVIALLAVAGALGGALYTAMDRPEVPDENEVANLEKKGSTQPSQVIVRPNPAGQGTANSSHAGGSSQEEDHEVNNGNMRHGVGPRTPSSGPRVPGSGGGRGIPGSGQNSSAGSANLIPGPSIDMLADLDLEQALVSGHGWTFEEGVLTSGRGDGTRIQIAHPEKQYVLRLTAERVSGTGQMHLGLPVTGGRVSCNIDVSHNRPVGSYATGFYDGSKNTLMEKTGSSHFAKGSPVEVVCIVQAHQLLLHIDGKFVGAWRRDARPLEAAEHWDVPEANALALGVSGSTEGTVYKISKLQCNPYRSRPIASTTTGPGSSQGGQSVGPPVNLLAGLDLKQAVVDGEGWTLEDGVLMTGLGKRSRIKLPHSASEYLLVATVERVAGAGHFILGLPLKGGQVLCGIDFNYDRPQDEFASGYYDEEVKPLMEKVGSSHFASGKPVQIGCVVRNDLLSLQVDGTVLGAWRRDSRPLKLTTFWNVLDENALVLGADDSKFKITKLEYRPYHRAQIASTTPGPDTDEIVGAFGEKVPGERDPFAGSENTSPMGSEPPRSGGSSDNSGKKPDPPSEKKQAETIAVLQDLFPDEFAAAKSTAGKLALGQKLYETAQKTNDDPEALYVLLTQAVHYAAEGGNAEIPMRALANLNRQFNVDLIALYVETFDKVLKGARSSAEHEGLLFQVKQAIAAAQAEDRYEEAEKLMRMAQSSARVTKDSDVLKEIAASAKQLRDAKSEFDKVSSAKEALASDPDNADANTEWGRYLCTVKNDFGQGMPLLVKGSNAQLKAAATADLAQPGDSKDQIAVGDKWFALADAASGSAETMLRLRAGFWYQRGVLGLTGLEKTRIEKRLSDIAKIDRDGIPQAKTSVPPARRDPAPATEATGRISMVGRGMIEGQDMGVTLTYELGQTISGRNVREALNKVGVAPDARVELNLGGNLLLRKPTELTFRIAGGSSSGGVCYLQINQQEIAAVGDDRNKDTTVTRMLPAGIYLIGMRITGGDMGNCVLECTETESKNSLSFRTELLMAALRNLPNKATINLGQIAE